MDYRVYMNFDFNQLNFETNNIFEEVFYLLKNIKSEEITKSFSSSHNMKSISRPLSDIISDKLTKNSWISDKPILKFTEELDITRTKRWTLDFYKQEIGLEIAFDHNVGISWNIMKLFITASNTNYKKATNINYGVIITADNQLKSKGGFDGSIGTFEQYIEHSKVYESLSKTPILIIGLCAPDDFWIRHRKMGSKKIGKVREY